MPASNFSLNPELPLALLKACPAYSASPLTMVDFRGQPLLVKDETARMGLGAFKALGGVYAVARLIDQELGTPIPPQDFISDDVKSQAANMTFVCASAGNHGMAVAAGAQLFGAQARIHLADTVPQEFAGRLEAKGARVVRSGETYEASIQAAIKDAEDTGALHLADGSWPGYTEPPRLVMEGYTVIAEEMRDSFEQSGEWPSHVYLQAGVGGLAGAIAAMIRERWTVQPEIIVVEPTAAPCIAKSVEKNEMVEVEGPVSNMGRLDCKAPSMLAFEILRKAADRFVTVSDEQALHAVEDAKKLGFNSTPSGVAGLAALALEDARARPLVIFSEGGLDG